MANLTRRFLLAGVAFALMLPLAMSVDATTIFGNGRQGGDDTNLLNIQTSPFSDSIIGTTTPARLSGLAFQPGTGTLFASSGFLGTNRASLFTVNTTTGVASLVGATGVPGRLVNAIAFDSSGTLFASDLGNLYTLDPGTAAPTLVGPFVDSLVQGLAFHPTTGILYGVDDDIPDLFTINTSTGRATSTGTLTGPGLSALVGLAFDSSGNLFASVGGQVDGDDTPGDIISVDISTLTTSLIGNANNGRPVSDIAIAPASIPEPTTLLLLGLGLAGLGWGL